MWEGLVVLKLVISNFTSKIVKLGNRHKQLWLPQPAQTQSNAVPQSYSMGSIQCARGITTTACALGYLENPNQIIMKNVWGNGWLLMVSK